LFADVPSRCSKELLFFGYRQNIIAFMFFARRTTRFLCVLMLGMSLAGCSPAFSRRVTPDAAAKKENVPMLLYHHIEDVPATASVAKQRWSLSPKKFEAQLDWISARGFHPVTMEQWIAHVKHGQSLPAKPIVLSFDDGWKEHYAVVFPALKKRNFAGTFFIITDSVGHSAYVNWEQLQEMSASGMDIQSHALTHSRLSTLPPEKALREILDSKKILENRLNKPVVLLAYPYGSYDDDVIAAAKAAGLEGAATISGLNGGYLLRADQSYTLVRYAIESNDDLAGIARLKGFDQK
jgi:peptidoglycan/xylan/chitin deacetylase (PgdA/CDA1 family)